MSTMNSAFIRAYTKEKLSDKPAPETSPTIPEGVSPYALFETSRRPELRYRVEPMESSWGNPVPQPHASFSMASLGESEHFADDDFPSLEFNLAPAPTIVVVKREEPIAPELPALRAATPVVAATPVAPPVPQTPSAPTKMNRPAAKPLPAPVVRDEFMCLPGVSLPATSYSGVAIPNTTQNDTLDVAALLETTSIMCSSTATAAAPSKKPVTKTNTTKPDAPAPTIVKAEAPIASSIVPPVAPVVVTPVVEPKATTAEVPKVDVAPVEPETSVATTKPAGLTALSATTALWEVDRFYFPDVVDRLLREYSYFIQAGEKLRHAAADGMKTLAITGLGREEGRSTLAMCLAKCAAKAGVKVCLVDADFAHPVLAEQLGLEITAGWNRIALGKSTIPETAIHSIEDGLTLLPLSSDNGKMSLADPRARGVLEQAARLFDVVILDLGPASSAGDFDFGDAARAPFDAALLVCDRRTRTLDDARAVALNLQAKGVEAVGIAENFSLSRK